MARLKHTEIPFPHGNHYAGYAQPTLDADILAWLNWKAPVPCAVCGAKRATMVLDVEEKGRPVYVCGQPLCIGNGVLEAQDSPQGMLYGVRIRELAQP